MKNIFLSFLFLWGWSIPIFSFAENFKIVEVFPNTQDDKNLEYIDVKNISTQGQSLSGFILADKKKEHQIEENIILQEGEIYRFTRPKTKLILNNSREEIFLYNQDKILVDSISYKSSEKGYPLYFLQADSLEDTQGKEDIISEEIYFSGEVYVSDEAAISSQNNSLDSKKDIFSVPEIIFSLQRPSYIFQSGSTNEYICETQRDECKVNFDLRESFSDDFPSRDYDCEIDFGIGSGALTGQEARCNPNTVIFPQGEYEVVFRIFHEEDKNIFSEKKIRILHDKSLKHINSRTNPKNTSHQSKISLASPKIIVQSGLDGGGKYFYCKKSECKINLNYEKKHSDERCFWNFGVGEKSSSSTHTRCNPGYVAFPPGTFELSLKVYEKKNEQNYKKKIFYIYNEPEQFEVSQAHAQEVFVWRREEEKIVENISREQQHIAGLEIVLQGRISKEKRIGGNKLYCEQVEKCYVNLTASGNILGENIAYIWRNNGEIFSQNKNPQGIWIEGEGKYEIVLDVLVEGEKTGEQKFFVYIVPLEKKTLSQDEDETNASSPKIKKIKNAASLNFLPLKYDGLRISGKYLPHTSLEIFRGEDLFGSVQTDEKGKYRFVRKNISAGEYIFTLKSGENIVAQKKYELTAQKRAYWFQSKKSKSSKSKNPKKTQLTITRASAESRENQDAIRQMGWGEKILFFSLMALSGALGVLHILFLHFSQNNICISSRIFTLQFSVRQKVILSL